MSMVSRGVLGKILSAGWDRWSFFSAQHWWGHTWTTVFGSGLFNTIDTWASWRESNERLWSWWTGAPWGKTESWDCLAWGRVGSGGCEEWCILLIPINNWRDCAEDGDKFFSMFYMNVRKYFSVVSTTKNWTRSPREVVESVSLERVKSCSWATGSRSLCLRGVGSDELQSSLLISTILWTSRLGRCNSRPIFLDEGRFLGLVLLLSCFSQHIFPS